MYFASKNASSAQLHKTLENLIAASEHINKASQDYFPRILYQTHSLSLHL